MTDSEITKLCAVAMGEVSVWQKFGPNGKVTNTPKRPPAYDPLHDDAQAIELVKKLRLNIGPVWVNKEPMWAVSECVRNAPTKWTEHADLNRAICLCVAKMQASK